MTTQVNVASQQAVVRPPPPTQPGYGPSPPAGYGPPSPIGYVPPPAGGSAPPFQPDVPPPPYSQVVGGPYPQQGELFDDRRKIYSFIFTLKGKPDFSENFCEVGPPCNNFFSYCTCNSKAS